MQHKGGGLRPAEALALVSAEGVSGVSTGTGTSNADLDRLIQDLAIIYQPERVILFGLRARGDARASSDIDLLIVKETDQRFVERIVEVFRLLKPKIALDILVYTPAEFAMLKESNSFVKQAVREGKEIYTSRTASKR